MPIEQLPDYPAEANLMSVVKSLSDEAFDIEPYRRTVKSMIRETGASYVVIAATLQHPALPTMDAMLAKLWEMDFDESYHAGGRAEVWASSLIQNSMLLAFGERAQITALPVPAWWAIVLDVNNTVEAQKLLDRLYSILRERGGDESRFLVVATLGNPDEINETYWRAVEHLHTLEADPSPEDQLIVLPE